MRYLSKTAFSAVLLCLAFFAAAPVVAQGQSVTPETLIERLLDSEAQGKENWQENVKALIVLREAAIPPLSAALRATQDDDTKATIIYLINVVLSQARFGEGDPITVPQELIDQLTAIIGETDMFILQVNILNLAANIGPDALPMASSILAFLRDQEVENARFTAMASLGRLGEGVLPMVQNALQTATQDRFRGDLAQMLRGTEIRPQDQPILEELLRSDDANVRKQAMWGLESANVERILLIEAARRNLADADGDQPRIQAAYDLTGLGAPAPQIISALQAALLRMESPNGQDQLGRLMGSIRPEGPRALADTLAQTQDMAMRSVLMRLLAVMAVPDARVVEVLLDVAMQTDENETLREALWGLRRTGEIGAVAIEVALSGVEDAELRRGLQEVILAIRAQ